MKQLIMAITMLLSFQIVMAQTQITGKITDEGGVGMPGVTVLVKGTNNGTITNIDGQYTLQIDENAKIIVISSVGYLTKEIAIEGQNTIDVQMETDVQGLEEVVVVGYGVQKKRDITGSISSVNGSDIANQPSSDVATLLQGRAAGVFVTQNSGAPGGGISVRIRGTGTVNNSSPLYVVDGILLDDISNINPSDIQTMDVLKDASASAIYGSRGANGVVLITTKTGDSKDVKVNLEMMYGFQQVSKKPDFLNSQDWINTYNTAQANALASTGSSAYTPLTLLSPSDDVNRTTNWFDEVSRLGNISKTNATITRGDENSNTLFSVGYFNNNGIINNSKYERINARLNTNYTISSIFKTGINLAVSNAANDAVSDNGVNGILTLAQRLDPLTPVKDPVTGDWASTPYSDLRNPVAKLEREVDQDRDLLILANTYLEIKPIENLVFRTALNLNLSRTKSKTYYPAYQYVGGENLLVNTLTKGNEEFTGWLTENTLTYTLNKADHNLSLMAGFTAEQNIYEYLTASRNNLPGDIEELQFISASTDQESTNAWNSGTDTRMFSYMGRLNYNYAGKYFLTATFRRDGSSVFGPNYRFANFPSVSLGWKLRNEKFMDFLSTETVSRMMIRIGWGQVGNAKIPTYGFASTLQKGDSRVEYSYVFSDQEYPGLAPVKMANLDMRWETVESTNVGIDLGFLEDKISLTVDYFAKETRDMLVQVPLPVYAGYDGSPYVNAGSVLNKGLEINLGYNGKFGQDFKYSINLNATHIKNEVTSLGKGNPILGGSATLVGNTTRTIEGQPIGAFYGYQIAGVFQTDAEAASSAQAGEGVGAGDFMFVDQWTDLDEDGIMEEPDGVINSDDRVYIGSPIPDLYYGLNINMNYKGFDFAMFFQGVFGNEIFNAFKYYNYDISKKYAMAADYMDHWTSQNGSNSMFGLNTATATANRNLRVSDFYIEDGSYFRLKNLQIGYTFNNVTDWLSSVRVYFSGQNLFTITKYSGLEPEVGGGTLSQGVDYSTYPQSRIFSFGANIYF